MFKSKKKNSFMTTSNRWTHSFFTAWLYPRSDNEQVIIFLYYKRRDQQRNIVIWKSTLHRLWLFLTFKSTCSDVRGSSLGI